MKTWKMASITNPTEQCTYTVIRNNEAKTDPYTVYREWYCEGKHRQRLARYADLGSALYYITDLIIRHNHE